MPQESRSDQRSGEVRGERRGGARGALDINRASRDELLQLDGLGEVMVDRMMRVRQGCEFRSLDDLRRVEGMGPRTMELLRGRVRFGGEGG